MLDIRDLGGKLNRILMLSLMICLGFVALILVHNHKTSKKQPDRFFIKMAPDIELSPINIKKEPTNPIINNVIPSKELTYEEVNNWLDEWHKSAPDITEVGVVGKHLDKEIRYIRIGNKTGPKVLITSGIHGNEKLCCMTMIGVFGKLLQNYMDDDRITKLLNDIDVYFVPIVSPDGYVNNRRHTENLDPNRNWTNPDLSEKESIPCVKAMKELHLNHKFKSVMSCHNSGRLYFYPWGYTNKNNELSKEYRSLLSEMTAKNRYTYFQLHGRSPAPYYGYEVDWYHKHGAFSIINEIGRSFQARKEEIEKEVEDNYESTIIFIEKAALIRL